MSFRLKIGQKHTGEQPEPEVYFGQDAHKALKAWCSAQVRRHDLSYVSGQVVPLPTAEAALLGIDVSCIDSEKVLVRVEDVRLGGDCCTRIFRVIPWHVVMEVYQPWHIGPEAVRRFQPGGGA